MSLSVTLKCSGFDKSALSFAEACPACASAAGTGEPSRRGLSMNGAFLFLGIFSVRPGPVKGRIFLGI